MMRPVVVVGCAVILLAVTAHLLAANRKKVAQQCDLRRRILAGDNVVPMEVDVGLTMTRFPLVPSMEGLGFKGNPEVEKMMERARTGGGFCTFTFRLPVGTLVRYLFHVQAADGGIRARGRPMLS